MEKEMEKKYYFLKDSEIGLRCLPAEMAEKDMQEIFGYRFLLPRDLRAEAERLQAFSTTEGDLTAFCPENAAYRRVTEEYSLELKRNYFAFFGGNGRGDIWYYYGWLCTPTEFAVAYREIWDRYPAPEDFLEDTCGATDEAAVSLDTLRNSDTLTEPDLCRRMTGGVLYLPEGFRRVGPGLLQGDFSVNVLIIPEGYESIEMSAFRRCGNLRTVMFPYSLRHIREHAFDGCRRLHSVLSWGGIETIGEEAFYGNDFWSVELPNSVRSIGKQAFYSSHCAYVHLGGGVEVEEDSFHSDTLCYAPMDSDTMRRLLIAGCKVRSSGENKK